MFKFISKSIMVAFILSLSLSVSAQEAKEPKADSEWVKPCQPFRIAGNLYYVGTHDLACYLITTSKGNILINTGLAASAAQIRKSIETLGFKYADTKILLTTQAHYDHMGAMAAIKKSTHAKLMADEKEADVLESGGLSDYELGKYGVTFKPVKPDRLLKDSAIIKLGGMKLLMLHHPGHTKGSCSFLFTVKDNGQSYRVLIANLPSIIVDRPFAAITAYPTIASDYAYTLRVMKDIPFDIWLASHASQFKLHDKHQPGNAYSPAAFIDPKGYADAMNNLQKQYDEKLKKDAALKMKS
jgi:metallo-beta-lactamase class B